MTVNPLEIRMAHLEGAYEQVSERLGSIETRIDRLDERLGARMDALEAKLDRQGNRIDGLRTELLSRMDRQFYWFLTLIIVAILLPLFLRFMDA